MRRALVALALVACSSPLPVEAPDASHDAAAGDSGKDTGPGACTLVTWYPDVDRDGYGAAYPTGAGTLTACTKPAQGWVTDHTDCADQDPRAHPGATTPSDTSVVGAHPNTPAFDLDCDGKETQTYPQSALASCEYQANNPPTCALAPGWRLPADAAYAVCGAKAAYATACPPMYPCVQDTGQWTWSTIAQTCL